MSETYRFGDLVEKYIDNRGKTPPLSEDGVPLLEVKHLPAEGKYPILQTLKHVSRDVYNTWFRAHLEAGDILFSTVGTTGRVSITPKNTKVAIAQNVLGLRFKSSLFDPAFAFYYLRSKPFQHEIESRLITTVQASIKRSDMVGIPMHLPEIPVQKAIASLLGVLDDKIENNRRMNETLEEMARAIFKSWFVDFDPVHAKAAGNAPAHTDADTAALFPSSFGDDGLPVGWNWTTLSEVCNIKSGKRPPSKLTAPDAENNVSVYGGNGISWYTNDTLFDPPFVITGRVGTLGTVYRVYEKCWVSDNALCCFPNGEEVFELIYFAMKEINYQSLNSGSTQPLLTQTILKNQNIINASIEIVSVFHRQIKILFKKVLANEEENQILTQMRDILLPKLMSGEIRVKDAAEQIGEVV